MTPAYMPAPNPWAVELISLAKLSSCVMGAAAFFAAVGAWIVLFWSFNA